ncbi:hypothetical protein ACWPKS_02285 [Coraliomargarita sp. W4R72]
MGKDFDTNDAIQVANQVEVPRVKIKGTSDTTTGNYAFWVGDENAKAKIRPYSEKASSVNTTDMERARFATNQRYGIEYIDSKNQLLSSITGFESELSKLSSTDSISVLNSVKASGADEIEKFLNRNIHSLTTHSGSLLTNTMTGGLKTDLSQLLRNATSTAFTPPNGLPAYADGAQSSFVKYPTSPSGFAMPAAPTWEQLISFYQDAESEGTIREIQKQTPQQHGVFPVITRFRLDMIALFEHSDSPTTIGDRFYLCLAPVIVLSNPYNTSLQISANTLYANFLIEDRNKAENTGLFLASDWIKNYKLNGSSKAVLIESFAPSSPGRTTGYPFGESDIPNLLENGNLTKFTDSNGRNYSGFNFKFPATTLAPGEVKAFGIANDDDLYTGENSLEEGAFDINPKVVRLLNADSNGDELRTSTEWAAADDSDEKKSFYVSGALEDITYGEQGALQLNSDISSQTDPKRAAPFNLTIGLSSRSNANLTDDDFYQLAQGIESTNPNANMLYVSSTAAGRNHRPTLDDGIYNFTAMAGRAIQFDVALGAAFEYADNDKTTAEQESNSVYYGYLINNRWLQSTNPFAPHIQLSAGDDANSPNQLYGSVVSFLPWAETGNLNMHTPEVNMSSDGNNAYWGTGVSLSDGVSTVTAIDLPNSNIDILSLAHLQHFRISDYSHSSLFGIASGKAPLRIGALDQLVAASLSPNALSGSLHPIDTSYLVNDALWDQFYFSGLQTDLSNSDLQKYDSVPLNGNYRFVKEPELFRTNDSQLSASEFVIDGGFNINSTKVEAWKALLAGANQLNFDPTSGGATGSLQSPISRFVYPKAGSGNSKDEQINGFRELSDNELQKLAQAIVAEVKERGPFLSLSDFVNRRLQTTDRNQGLYGAIESAIRKSGINSKLVGQEYLISDTPSNFTPPNNYITEVFNGNLLEGIAQWVQQADILQRIAPLISARSDTFKIRAYGEVVDPINGNIVSALCEAVVQRQYDYINTDDPVNAANYVFDKSTEKYLEIPLDSLNEMFGRKYEIVNFKWL